MQLKKHIKRAYHRSEPCRKCGGNHTTGGHDKAVDPEVYVEDEEEAVRVVRGSVES
ncbi:hypothetical protein QEH52_01640 [Coraliomargarita sp. SDUM461003]|uniref:Uncharacterized protein n=1 Tax=Thalassobacterium maritimum TaxID=3041265 RepID=A0ABU1APV8_9BACT|nr:hypothetical protein [Coraliomargarita sp. SDUM461003]MDQ8206194.1 hypothetical protein [Coraliomargarita sp. SDUM461003]